MRFLRLIFVFIPFFILSQNQPNIDFEFINQDSNSISKNARLELGLTLPDSILGKIGDYLRGMPHKRTGLNPFVSWTVDVKAHFKHLSGEEEFTSIGFWYTEMERNHMLIDGMTLKQIYHLE